MKNFMLLMLLFVGGVLLFLWLYLTNYATKANVREWEQSYHVTFPAWLQNMPRTTGEVEESFFRQREKFEDELSGAKADVKVQFQLWLDEQAEKAKEKAKQEAHDRVDSQFSTGK